MTVTAVQNKTVYHFTKKLLFSMDEVIFSKNLRNNNLNCDSKKFFLNLKLGFVLKMSLIFGKISASCPYKLCPYSIKRVYTRHHKPVPLNQKLFPRP